MKINHTKNQFRNFTLISGRSLYLFPYAKNIEISEQEFYLTKRLQRYLKNENAISIQEYGNMKPRVSGYSSSKNYSSKKSGPFAGKKKKKSKSEG